MAQCLKTQGRPHLDLRAGSISMAPGTGILETSWAASRCTAPQNFFPGANGRIFVEKLKHHNNKSSVISIEIVPMLGGLTEKSWCGIRSLALQLYCEPCAAGGFLP